MTRALQIRSSRLGTVAEVTDFLTALDGAYNHIYAFDLIVSTAKQKYGESYLGARYVSGTPVRSLRRISKPEQVLLPEDRLRLHRVVIESPGFWEFIGALNPLEVVRKYLSDRHERQKDREFRNELEAERLRLENEQLRTQIARERFDLLRSLGVSEDRIREQINVHLLQPLSALDRAQDAGLIRGAEIVDLDNPSP